jgi:hypothetical protein
VTGRWRHRVRRRQATREDSWQGRIDYRDGNDAGIGGRDDGSPALCSGPEVMARKYSPAAVDHNTRINDGRKLPSETDEFSCVTRNFR